ncbi:MAG: DUF3105 domain-containing protein [Candidatus Nanohaloarchaea archaeon]|nr:DUF3105 domain-containing protein [Candidatus Nanohaloarchaea archaeon]
MPRYVCEACGEVFESKEAREQHTHDEDGTRFPGVDVSIPDLSMKQFAVLGGVFLMATLFMGTVFFASSLSPGTPGGGGTAAREPSPPVGYTIQSRGDIPSVSQTALPTGAVSDTPLPQDVQLYLLAQQSVLLQYSCQDCPGTVSDLENIASSFNTDRTWVYVAPYRDMDSKIAVTGLQRGPLRLDTVDRQQIETFICDTLQDRPIQCVV